MPVSQTVLKVAAISLATYALVKFIQSQWSIPVIGDYLPK